jgi:hypothetical protein
MYVGISTSATQSIQVQQMSASEANMWIAQGKAETKTVYLVPDTVELPSFSPSCSVNSSFLAQIVVDKGKQVAKHIYL